jgi:ABC-type bacteriocin/lantibiotic exporter with double-glycine peptidase domain
MMDGVLAFLFKQCRKFPVESAFTLFFLFAVVVTELISVVSIYPLTTMILGNKEVEFPIIGGRGNQFVAYVVLGAYLIKLIASFCFSFALSRLSFAINDRICGALLAERLTAYNPAASFITDAREIGNDVDESIWGVFFGGAIILSELIVTTVLLFAGLVIATSQVIIVIAFSVAGLSFHYLILKWYIQKIGNEARINNNLRVDAIYELLQFRREIIIYKVHAFAMKTIQMLSAMRARDATITNSFAHVNFNIMEVFAISALVFIGASGSLANELPKTSVVLAVALRMIATGSRLSSLVNRFTLEFPKLKKIAGLTPRIETTQIEMKTLVELKSIETRPKFLIISQLGFSFSSKIILRDLSWKLDFGNVVGLFGKSGAGKSTLFDILAGLLKPTEGQAFIIVGSDSLPLSTIAIGYASQKPLLIRGTVLENVAIGREMPLNDLRDAMMIAELGEFIEMNDEICFGGGNYSGGQLQRVSLARAVAGKPTLLLIDEATSGVDEATELKILENVKNYARRNRSLVIWATHNRRIHKLFDQTFELETLHG